LAVSKTAVGNSAGCKPLEIMKKSIEVYKNCDQWVAKINNPEIVDLFGYDVLPTPFTDKVSADLVYKEIQAANPECDVIVYEK